jgi:hypothetical protein
MSFRRNVLLAVVCVTPLGCSLFGGGQSSPGGSPLHHGLMKKLTAADSDGNGQLSRDEVQRSVPRLMKHFDEIDTNHDGQLSPDELRAYFRARWHLH